MNTDMSPIEKYFRGDGLTALEIEHLKEPDFTACHKSSALMLKYIWPSFRVTVAGILLVAVVVDHYLGYPVALAPWLITIIVVVCTYAVLRLGQVSGYRSAFSEGYERGYEDAMDKVLGLTAKQANENRELATEMRVAGCRKPEEQ